MTDVDLLGDEGHASPVATHLMTLSLGVRIATEVSPGTAEPIPLSGLINMPMLVESIRSQLPPATE
jgi:hypothetical protein